MSAAETMRQPVRPSPFAVGAVGCALLTVWTSFVPRGVLQGWLIALAISAGALLGALALLCLARLTGGRWADAASPVLLRAAAATPLLCLVFLPPLLGAHYIFPWAADPGAAGEHVARYYLNVDFLAMRGAIALIGLSIVAVMLLLGRGGRLIAAVGLILYAVAVDFTSVDWMLSLAPRFSSSGFGAEIAIQDILSALALILLILPASRQEGTTRDLSGLTLAASLGVLYMETMALIVNWYGDQPDRAAWYLARVARPWLWLALAAVVFGAAGPIIALLFDRVRRSVAASRLVGASILLGVALHCVWLMAPNAAPTAAPAALVALATIVALALGFSSRLQAWLAKREAVDGR
jgi:hypothetical protein